MNCSSTNETRLINLTKFLIVNAILINFNFFDLPLRDTYVDFIIHHKFLAFYKCLCTLYTRNVSDVPNFVTFFLQVLSSNRQLFKSRWKCQRLGHASRRGTMFNGVAANRSGRLVWSCYRRNARKGADQYNVIDITGENEPEKPSFISMFGVPRFREPFIACSLSITRPIVRNYSFVRTRVLLLQTK